MEDDYSTELGKDGSLVLVSVELKHAGIYTFIVSNRVGSVKGCIKVVVHTEDEECGSASRVESNPVIREKFEEFALPFMLIITLPSLDNSRQGDICIHIEIMYEQ